MPISTHPSLPYFASFFALLFLAFGTSYILRPRVTYSAFGLPYPETEADRELMDAVMLMYGARDAFMGVAILAAVWRGSRQSAGIVLMAASVCAGVDGWVVKGFTGEGEWAHWGYGGLVGVLGVVMGGLLG